MTENRTNINAASTTNARSLKILLREAVYTRNTMTCCCVNRQKLTAITFSPPLFFFQKHSFFQKEMQVEKTYFHVLAIGICFGTVHDSNSSFSVAQGHESHTLRAQNTRLPVLLPNAWKVIRESLFDESHIEENVSTSLLPG